MGAVDEIIKSIEEKEKIERVQEEKKEAKLIGGIVGAGTALVTAGAVSVLSSFFSAYAYAHTGINPIEKELSSETRDCLNGNRNRCEPASLKSDFAYAYSVGSLSTRQIGLGAALLGTLIIVPVTNRLMNRKKREDKNTPPQP